MILTAHADHTFLRGLALSLVLSAILLQAGCSPQQSGVPTSAPGEAGVPSAIPSVMPEFTSEEKAWLAQHPVIRMGVEQDFPPYESVDTSGDFSGISADYRNLIDQRLGMELQVRSFASFSMIHDKLKSKDLDVVLLLTPTDERKTFLLFTEPFFDYQLVIVTRDDYPVVLGLDDFRGKTVAVVKDYASAEYVVKHYPQLRIVSYPTLQAGLLAVSTGKADAFVNEVFATVYQIRRESISNVKISAHVDAQSPGYAIGVRDDWPELVGILDKVLTSITPEERLDISEKWLSVRYERGFDYSLLWKYMSVALFVLGVLFLWNRRLSGEINTRKQAEQALRESEQRYRLLFDRSASAIAVLNTDYDVDGRSRGYHFLDVNPTFEQLTGRKRENVIGQDAREVLPGFDQYWTNLSEREGVASTDIDQYVAPLDRYVQGTTYSPQPGQYALSFMDVTERKHAEDELRKYQHHLEELVQERTADLEESEANFRAMAENASDAILIAAGEDGRYVFANIRAEELTGRSSSELCTLEITGLVPVGEREKVRGMYEHLARLKETPVRYETTFVNRSGAEVPVEITAASVHWQGGPAAMAIIRDISERRKREGEIIRQNYELGVLAEVSNVIGKISGTAELAEFILGRVLGLSGLDWGVLFTMQDGQLSIASEIGRPAGLKSIPDSVMSAVAEMGANGQARFPNQTGDEAEPSARGTFQAQVVIALKSFDTPLGAIVLLGDGGHPASSQERRLMTAIADMAGTALERLQTMATLEERVADRTRDLSTLYQVMTIANQTDRLDQILEEALRLALKAVGCPSGCIHLLDPSGKSWELAAETKTSSLVVDGLWDRLPATALADDLISNKRPILIADISADQRLTELAGQVNGELIGVPLLVAGSVKGALWAYSDRPGHLTLEDIALLASISERIGTSLENFRLRERTQQVAVLEERQRLARDLHDSVTQQIYSLLLMAGGAKRNLVHNEGEKAGQLVGRIETISRQALKELRLMIFALRPIDLVQVGLVEALHQRLEAVEERGGVHTQLISLIEGRIPAEMEEQLYRIAIEALNNSLKHAAAADVEVRLRCADDCVELDVRDNGVGFDTAREQHGGTGLLSMRERAVKIGGTIQINSAPGAGTLISVRAEAKNAK